MNEQVKEFANKIGNFYLQKNNGDKDKAYEELIKLQLTDISVEVVVKLKTARPGLLIGNRGQNVENLGKFLGAKVKIEEETNSVLDMMSSNYIEDDEDDLNKVYIDPIFHGINA